MKSGVFSRLSIMMFLQFFLWGAWYVTVGNYMSHIGMTDAIYWAYTVGPIAAMISPFFLGMIADRFFAAERVLGVLHIVGGVALFVAPMVAEGENVSPLPFILLLLLHMLCYMPTIGLTNTLAFHNLTNQEKQFPLIRVFGTLGWIIAGVVVSDWLKADYTATPLRIAGAAGVVMGFYSFTLPHTPPQSRDRRPSAREIIGLDAAKHLSSTSFWVFIIASLLICIPLSAYYAYAPVYLGAARIESPAGFMKWGQVSEVAFMVSMPLFFARLGVKWMLIVGMLAWVVRYGLFAGAAMDNVTWMLLGGVLLHGICYDFFFVTGYIYVDKKSTPEIRGQAQGFLVFVTLGVGMLIGSLISGWLKNGIVVGPEESIMEQWRTFWIIPTIGAGVIMLAFAALFKDDSAQVAGTTEAAQAKVGNEA